MSTRDLIIETKATLGEILQVDPFSTLRTLSTDSESLTSDEFFSFWHVTSEEIELLCARFDEEVNSPLSLNQLLFVNGMGGSGKSTFLRYIKSRRPQYSFKFVDFDHPATRARVAGPVGRRLVHELTSLDSAEFWAMIRFLNTVRNEADAVFGEGLVQLYTCNQSDRDGTRAILNGLETDDLLRLFTLSCFRTGNPNKKNILVFDNLDSIGTDYLTEEMQLALANLVRYSRDLARLTERPSIARTFRFVLCLRDVNHAVVDAQLRDNLGGRFRTFDFAPGSDLHRRILRRRIKIAGEVYSQGDSEGGSWEEHCRRNVRSLAVVRAVLEATEKDDYFSNVLAPIYNNNLKQVAVTIQDVVREVDKSWVGRDDPMGDFLADLVRRLAEDERLYRYGFHGALLKLFVRQNAEFLTLYRTYTAAGRYPEAYCLHHRVLLVLVSNLKTCRVRFNSGFALETEFCGLWEIVTNLGLVYPIREILAAVGECFEVYKTGWGNLLLVRNKDLALDPRFELELEAIAAAGVETEIVPESIDAILGLPSSVRSRLKEIRVRLTPAGFCYVRHILTSLEFYSMVASIEGEGEDLWYKNGIFSLFQCGLLLENDGSAAQVQGEKGEPRFLFERYLGDVFRVAENHVALMNSFYDATYREKLGLSPGDFALSRLAFKHRGNRSTRRRRGHFHAYALLTTHIGYIEMYRRYCLELGGREEYKDRMVGSVELANLKLARILEKYVGLLRGTPGSPAAGAAKKFSARLRRILASGGSDTTTLVRLPKRK